MKTASTLAIAFLGLAAGQAFALPVNDVRISPRIFNDNPFSSLTITDSYPGPVRFEENFPIVINPVDGRPLNGLNRHSAYFSADNGASNYDFDYTDGFQICTTLTYGANHTPGSSEAGIHSDLFGFGYFGQLPNGEIAAFGSLFPFHSFGVQPFANSIQLRMTHVPGTGDGSNPLPMGGTPSYMLYEYNTGSGWVSSGYKAFGGIEGGIVDFVNNGTLELPFFIGFGVQNRSSATNNIDVTFESKIIPAPGALSLLGLGSLVALRRRR